MHNNDEIHEEKCVKTGYVEYENENLLFSNF